MKMLIDVIVPAYNVEKYIEKCLESLCCQTLQDLRILVINDGSQDKTEAIVYSMMEKYPERITYYYKENGGIADTRNFGLSKVEAKYFGFVDSDDYVELTMFEKMVSVMETEESDLAMCGFTWEYVNKKDVVSDGPFQDMKDQLMRMYATLWNKVYRTEWIHSLNLEFPIGLCYEDASFLYRLVPHCHHISYVNESLLYYVQRENSITHTYNVRIEDMIHVFSQIQVYYKKQGFMEEFKDELEYVFVRFFLGNSYLRTVQIQDSNMRNEILKKAWEFLNVSFPDWKHNVYLKGYGLKNLYYRTVGRRSYYFNAKVFHVLLKIKKFIIKIGE